VINHLTQKKKKRLAISGPVTENGEETGHNKGKNKKKKKIY